MNETTTTSTMTDWIVAISAIMTAIILFFYTKYTYQMQQSIASQVDEQIRQTKILKEQIDVQSRQTKAVEEQVKQQIVQTEELVHQRRLGIMPLLILKVENTDNLIIENVGNGTAINVKIRSSNSEGIEKPEINFEEILMIKPNEPINVSIKGMLTSDSIYLLKVGLLRFGKICLQDIEGNTYEEDLSDCVDQEIKFSFPILKEKE